MAESMFHRVRTVADRAQRFAAFDPLLNAARAAGLVRWGPKLSALVHATALRWPMRTAVIDDRGALSYRGLDRCADRLARSLRANGSGPVGLLCRNHRGFILGHLALERAGRDVVLLSTGLPTAQLSQIVVREELDEIIADSEFSDTLAGIADSVRVRPADPAKIASWGRSGVHTWPLRRSDVVLLTSGTTGPPKGARQGPRSPSLSDAGLLDALPIRVGDTVLIASPLFHAWGFAQSAIALATGSTVVLQSRFEPDATLDALKKHRVTTLAAVPLMLGRLLEAAEPDLRLPALRTVLSSGNILSASLATAWIDRFGPNLYNIYGSTETAIASVATPQDLIAAPGTVGRPPKGVHVAILGDDDEPVSVGALGRVFTANSMQFDGYTDGSNRTRIDKLMATGDLGYLDADGRLFVDGRENDLIVTGGENVFPSQIEELLEHHPLVRQAAAVGLADDEYGQIVAAFVVTDDAFDPQEFDHWTRQQLAGFQRPRRIQQLDKLPMTTTGKVKRNELAGLLVSETSNPTTRKTRRKKTS